MSLPLRPTDVARLRIESLLLGSRRLTTPLAIARWFGAMQAQDLASGKWSFGVRLKTKTEKDIDRAIESGSILRTWPMRGTIHFIPAEDAHWLLELTGKLALKTAPKRRAFLGLSEKTANDAANTLGKALAGGHRMTRDEILELWRTKGLNVEGQKTYHLLWYACQLGIGCIGPNRGKEQTFVLLDDWVKKPRKVSPEEALRELTLRYFQSHGPASQKDYAGWTGLSAAITKRAINLLGNELTSISCLDTTLYLTHQQCSAWKEQSERRNANDCLVLPGFDEYLLGIKDRSAVLAKEDQARIIPGKNGIFMPTLVVNGTVKGTWKRTLKTKTVIIEAVPFVPLSRVQKGAFTRAFEEYAAYLDLTPTIHFT